MDRPLGTLTHNVNNPVTVDIARVQWKAGTCVRKTLSAHNPASTRPEWRASSDVAHWNYWRRELLIYQSPLPELFADTNLRLPRVLNPPVESEQTATLDLEDIEGVTGHAITRDQYADIAFAWGQAQARFVDFPKLSQLDWLSQDFLRAYTQSKLVNYDLLNDAEAWSAPLIADNWGDELAEKLAYLHAHAEDLYALLEAAPRTLCHLDFWPNNVFIDTAGYVVPIDWTFFGHGAYAEDIGNFIPDSVFDNFMTPADLPLLEEQMFRGYCAGLHDGGVELDEDLLKRSLYASAVKYVWLGPLLLERAGNGGQQTYGGQPLRDANDQYLARGATLSYLCDWAEQAITA